MLLQILCQQGDISGYRINKIVEEREYRVWTDIGMTSIYTGLEKLKKKHLLTARIDVSKQGKETAGSIWRWRLSLFYLSRRLSKPYSNIPSTS